MKKIFIAFFLLCLVAYNLIANTSIIQSSSQTTQNSVLTDEKKFTPQEMIDDINTMIRTFEEVHPDLYYYTPKVEIDALKTEIIESLTRPLTDREFYPKVASLAAKFGDGHTGASIPGRRAYLDKGGLTFPFDIKRTLTGVTVLRNYADHSNLQSGDRLISINGVRVDQLFAQFLTEESGETLAYKTVLVEGSFGAILWTHDIMPPYTIEYESLSANKQQVETVQGITSQTLVQRRGNNPNQSLPYHYEDLTSDISYLDFQTMSTDKAAFDSFLEVMFKLMKNEKSKGLIVDLRKNGGGNSALGQSLLSYITSKPYMMANRKEWKISQPYKDMFKNGRSQSSSKYMDAKNGELLVFKSNMINPDPNPLRFEGPVCFLIGHFTFSSAMMTANAVGDYKLATLIGEDTGDPPTSFGELYDFVLPNTKIRVNVSTAHYVRANGDITDKNPVLPDIRIVPTENDLRNNVDTVLEFAKKWILQQANNKEKNQAYSLNDRTE